MRLGVFLSTTALIVLRGIGASASTALSTLFGPSDTGFALDANASNAEYQDQVNTPANDPAEALGFLIDQSKSARLGVDLTTNGGFDTDTAWTKGSGVTIANGVADFSAVGTGLGVTQTLSGHTVGTWAEVTIVVSVWTSGNISTRIGTGSLTVITVTGPGTYTARVLSSGSASFQVVSSATGGTFKIDSVSVKELSGRHALQTNTALKPLMGKAPSPLYTLIAAYSQDITQSVWGKANGTATVSAVSTPYGDGDFACKFVDNSTSATHNVTLSSSSAYTTYISGQTYTHYFDLKAAEHSWVRVAFYSINGYFNANCWANFNLTTGAVGLVGASATAQITSLGNGWYRCAVTATALLTGSNNGPWLILVNNTNASAASGLVTYVGTGGGVYVAGAQTQRGSTVQPYQKVGAQTSGYGQSLTITQPAIVGVQNAAQSYWYIRYDGTDDKLAVNLAAGQTGTLILAGRSGTWVETITRASGDMNFGPSNIDGSSIPGIFPSVGDVVGIIYISRVMNQTEIDTWVAYFRNRGAGGILREGSELIVSGDGTSTTGWTANNATLTSDTGQLRVTGTTGSGTVVAAYQNISVTPYAFYVARAKATRQNTSLAGAIARIYSAFSGTIIQTIATGASVGVQVSGTVTFIGDSDGVNTLQLQNTTVNAIGSIGDFDDLSVKQLIADP